MLSDFHAARRRQAAAAGSRRCRMAWLKPLVRQLKHDPAVKVIRQLEEVLATLPAGPAASTVQREVNYFREHQNRLDYRGARRRGEPPGSGAIVATCRQYQCRFKGPGQFWSRSGDEMLLALETLWRNGRWRLLFPHAPPFDPAKTEMRPLGRGVTGVPYSVRNASSGSTRVARCAGR